MDSLSSSLSEGEESSSDTEILHDLCNKINLGLANASNITEPCTDSLNLVTTGIKNMDVKTDEIESDDKKLKKVKIFDLKPILNRNDSIDKVLDVIKSRLPLNQQPSTSKQHQLSQSNDQLTLNSETLLILNLLSMENTERYQYLIDIAQKRKLLSANAQTNTFVVNSELLNVSDIPQINKFVHQYNGKPVNVDVKTNQKDINVQDKQKNQTKKLSRSERRSIPNVITLNCANSIQSMANVELNKKVSTSLQQLRAQSVSETSLPSLLSQHQDVTENLSKRQRRRIQKELKAANVETDASVEKAPRKRGKRGGRDTKNDQAINTETASTSSMFNDSKDVIRNKCSLINAKIQVKLNKFAATSKNQPDDNFIIINKVESSQIDGQTDNVAANSSVKSMSNSGNELFMGNASVNIPPLIDDQSSTSSFQQPQLTLQQNIPNLPSNLNKESLYIMSLLTMTDRERNEFLFNAAIEHCIYLKKDSKAIINPRLAEIKTIFDSKLILNFLKRKSHLDELKIGKRNYENDVNYLVQKYTTEKDMFKYQLGKLYTFYGTDQFDNIVANEQIINDFVNKLLANNFGKIIEGDIRVNEYDNSEAYMSNENDDRDVYFSSLHLRQYANHGSRVKAFVFTIDRKESDLTMNKNVYGFVISVLDNKSNRVVGKFDINSRNKSFYTFIPNDRRFVRVRVNEFSDRESFDNKFQPKDGAMYLVEIICWKDGKSYGRVITEIGNCDDLNAWNRVILLKNGLNPQEFPDSIINSLPNESFIIPEIEYKTRDVLTNDCIFTIDPSTARDLDDAVSCKQLDNGNYQIGVHISDVSYFINENSDLDNLIKDQTTSIYLVNTVYHMLPRQLCMLCSLLPGQDKLTFSVFWEFTSDGQVINTKFTKSIINSCVQLSYDHAQLMIEEPNREFTENQLPKIYNNFTYHDLSKTINLLNSIALILRKQRYDNGCLSINQTKIVFDLNENGLPITFRSAERNESNFLIEEFMLLANQYVGKFIYEKFPEFSVLRNHAPPKKNLIVELAKKLASLHYELDITSSKTISDSLLTIMAANDNNPYVSTVLNSMVAKPMVRAEYFCSNYVKTPKCLVHYALSIPIYTHFTSPIRRYPDILVHRLLAAGLTLGPVPNRTPEELKSITRNCNDQKYNAKLAGEDSVSLYFLHYIRSIEKLKMKAAVRELTRGFELHVTLIDTGHNIRVNIKKNEPEVIFTSDDGIPTIQFITLESKPTLRVNIFDPVLVEVYTKSSKLKARLVPN